MKTCLTFLGFSFQSLALQNLNANSQQIQRHTFRSLNIYRQTHSEYNIVYANELPMWNSRLLEPLKLFGLLEPLRCLVCWSHWNCGGKKSITKYHITKYTLTLSLWDCLECLRNWAAGTTGTTGTVWVVGAFGTVWTAGTTVTTGRLGVLEPLGQLGGWNH